MRKVLLALVGAALALPALPAAAQSPADRTDVRCLLVMQLAARDPKAREQAAKGAYYYMGRLASRGSSARLPPILLAEARSITTAPQAKAELDRCAKELNDIQAQFQALNKNLAATAQPAKKAQ